MRNADIIAAIDIGSSHTVAALAETSPVTGIKLLAFAEIPSKGIKKGGIANISMVQHAIDAVLDELQFDGSYHIHSIITSLSGVSIMGHNADGSVEIRGNPITEHNIKQAVAVAKEVSMQEGRQLLHILRQSFVVDRQTEIDDPIDLLGEKLSVRVHVISAAKTAYYNLLQVFSHRDIDVEQVIASGLASALAVATPDEKQLGVCVLDIGAGTTDIVIIHNGIVKHTEVIQMGGELITSDIAFFMRSTIENAEFIKRQLDISHAYAVDDYFEVKGLSNISMPHLKRDIANVASERCQQLIEMTMQKIRRAGAEGLFPGGFVLCGGGANLAGMEKMIMQVTQLPARQAKIDISLNGETCRDSRFATLMGLFLCAYEEDYSRPLTSGRKTGIIRHIIFQFRELMQRLRQQF